MAKQHEFKSQTAKFMAEDDVAIAVDHALSGDMLPAIKEGVFGLFRLIGLTVGFIFLLYKWAQIQMREEQPKP